MGPALRGAVVTRGGQSRATLRRDVGDAVPYGITRGACKRADRKQQHSEKRKGERNMKMNLQMFAEANTQTTGGLSAEMKT